MTELIGWACALSAIGLLLGLCLAYLPQGRGRHRRKGAPNVTQANRHPDPYVMHLPSPHDARWRRWSRRAQPRIFGPDPLPHPAEEREFWGDGGDWQATHPIQRAVDRLAPFEDTGALVRPYVGRLTPERQRV